MKGNSNIHARIARVIQRANRLGKSDTMTYQGILFRLYARCEHQYGEWGPGYHSSIYVSTCAVCGHVRKEPASKHK